MHNQSTKAGFDPPILCKDSKYYLTLKTYVPICHLVDFHWSDAYISMRIQLITF